MVAQIQILFCSLFWAVDAVDHTAEFLRRMILQNAQGVGVGITDMEDRRLFQFPCKVQLIDEPDVLDEATLLLPLIVIVQSCFTDGDDFGIPCVLL